MNITKYTYEYNINNQNKLFPAKSDEITLAHLYIAQIQNKRKKEKKSPK